MELLRGWVRFQLDIQQESVGSRGGQERDGHWVGKVHKRMDWSGVEGKAGPALQDLGTLYEGVMEIENRCEKGRARDRVKRWS